MGLGPVRVRSHYWQTTCPESGAPYISDCGYYLTVFRTVYVFGFPVWVWEKKVCDVASWEMINQATLGDPSPTAAKLARRVARFIP